MAEQPTYKSCFHCQSRTEYSHTEPDVSVRTVRLQGEHPYPARHHWSHTFSKATHCVCMRVFLTIFICSAISAYHRVHRSGFLYDRKFPHKTLQELSASGVKIATPPNYLACNPRNSQYSNSIHRNGPLGYLPYRLRWFLP